MNDNRIISGMQEWMERENKVMNLFSPDTIQTRYFQQLKLDYIRELLKSARPNATSAENFARRVLKGEMKILEKKLYPSASIRFALGVARTLKTVFSRTVQQSAFEKTQWMIKIETRKQNPLRNSDARVYQKRTQTPQLVQKKRESQSKGLKR